MATHIPDPRDEHGLNELLWLHDKVGPEGVYSAVLDRRTRYTVAGSSPSIHSIDARTKWTSTQALETIWVRAWTWPANVTGYHERVSSNNALIYFLVFDTYEELEEDFTADLHTNPDCWVARYYNYTERGPIRETYSNEERYEWDVKIPDWIVGKYFKVQIYYTKRAYFGDNAQGGYKTPSTEYSTYNQWTSANRGNDYKSAKAEGVGLGTSPDVRDYGTAVTGPVLESAAASTSPNDAYKFTGVIATLGPRNTDTYFLVRRNVSALNIQVNSLYDKSDTERIEFAYMLYSPVPFVTSNHSYGWSELITDGEPGEIFQYELIVEYRNIYGNTLIVSGGVRTQVWRDGVYPNPWLTTAQSNPKDLTAPSPNPTILMNGYDHYSGIPTLVIRLFGIKDHCFYFRRGTVDDIPSYEGDLAKYGTEGVDYFRTNGYQVLATPAPYRLYHGDANIGANANDRDWLYQFAATGTDINILETGDTRLRGEILPMVTEGADPETGSIVVTALSPRPGDTEPTRARLEAQFRNLYDEQKTITWRWEYGTLYDPVTGQITNPTVTANQTTVHSGITTQTKYLWAENLQPATQYFFKINIISVT